MSEITHDNWKSLKIMSEITHDNWKSLKIMSEITHDKWKSLKIIDRLFFFKLVLDIGNVLTVKKKSSVFNWM
jgi:hypothetical protein